MKTIAVVGAGTMGTSIAKLFVMQGFQVTLLDHKDANLKRAASRIGSEASHMLFGTSYTLLKHADLVIEAVPENLSIKKQALKEISTHCPKTAIIASNTSSISLTTLSEACRFKKRFIGMHFMNPAHLMKLVEIVLAKSTSKETLRCVERLCKKLNKISVVSKDMPGFIVNRVLMPMINEAIKAYEEGVASKEDIDTAIRLGLNHPMGPLTLADYIGLDVCEAILSSLYKGLRSSRFKPAPLLSKMVKKGHLGKKRGKGFYNYTS